MVGRCVDYWPLRNVLGPTERHLDNFYEHKKQSGHEGETHAKSRVRALPSILNTSIYPMGRLLLASWSVWLVPLVYGQFWCNQHRVPRTDEQPVFRVGVYANKGIQQAIDDYSRTFVDYLTLTAGQELDPPARFELVAALPNEAYSTLIPPEVDFLFTNPAVFACLESEFGARSLATFVARTSYNGSAYDFDQFGGVIVVKAENDEISTVEDIKGKRVGALSMGGFGSGQMQFRILQQHGLHHLQDPKQIIFMGKQEFIAQAVYDGDIDVGFLRTGKLKLQVNETSLDISNFKVIAPRDDVRLADGEPLPFPISTRLYPEWSFSSYAHVSEEVRSVVQSSLVNIVNHAAIAPLAADCNMTGCENRQSECLENCVVLNAIQCQTQKPPCEIPLDHLKRCDTTPAIALTAAEALERGNYAGFKTSLSYITVHNLMEETGLLDDQTSTCAKPPYSTDAINCPVGFFQRDEEEIPFTCQQLDLDCLGFDCICSPCRKAFEVDFFPANTSGVGCAKFDVCGSVEQTHAITFILVDNMRRENVSFSVLSTDIENHDGEAVTLKAINPDGALTTDGGIQGSHVYSFDFEAENLLTGVVILQVYADHGGVVEQISQSPFRLAVVPRDCSTEMGDPHRVANIFGDCLCDENTMTIADVCISYGGLFYAMIPLLALIIVLVILYCIKMKKSSDPLWRIPPDELVYRDPPRTLGRGTFGLVLLAEYKGESVAVKRALPNAHETSLAARSAEQKRLKRRSVTRSASGKKFDYNNDVESFISTVESAQFSTTSTGAREKAPQKKKNIYGLKGDLMKEAQELSRLHHPCITTVHGAVVDIGEPLLVLEHVELGCLHDILHNDSMVIEGELALSILSDIACGMSFLHGRSPKVIHGELRARNVLINDRFQAKLTNYGFTQKRKNEGSIMSPQWKAPEILLGESDATAASDMYAFGIVFYEVFSRKDPYYDENFGDIMKKVVDSKKNKRPPIPGSCPPELVQLMESCLDSLPASRPSAESVDGDLNAAKTKARTNNLLLDVFPKHVAETIQLGQTVVPEVRDSVSVLFAGVVYDKPEDLDPSVVADAIRRLFSTFDQLCNRHNVLRVKTVGETFMAVANLAECQDDHEATLAFFALEAIEVASRTLVNTNDPECGTLCLRCGFHSGPVLAHLVGSHTPRYTIIGETVNTASKIEQVGKPGILNCSEDTAGSLLGRSDLKLSFLGPVCVDDMGEVVVFSVSKRTETL